MVPSSSAPLIRRGTNDARLRLRVRQLWSLHHHAADGAMRGAGTLPALRRQGAEGLPHRALFLDNAGRSASRARDEREKRARATPAVRAGRTARRRLQLLRIEVEAKHAAQQE